MRNAIEIAADIRKSDVWDYELCTELCKAAVSIVWYAQSDVVDKDFLRLLCGH